MISRNLKPFAAIFLGLVMACSSSIAQAQMASFNSPLVDAANRGDEARVLLLLSQGYLVDSQGDYDVTPLMRAAYNGNLRIVKVLLGMGANVNATDIAGATALHIAARQRRHDIIEELLRYHANVDAADQEGWTPLMRAATAKDPVITRQLLDNGADPFKVNNAGEYVLMLAVQSSSSEVVKVLVNKGVVTRDNPAVTAVLGTAIRRGDTATIQTLQRAISEPQPNTTAPVAPVTVTVTAPPSSVPEEHLSRIISAIPAFAEHETVRTLEEVQEEERRIALLKKEEEARQALLAKQQQQTQPTVQAVTPIAPAQEPPEYVGTRKRIYRLQAGSYNEMDDAKRAWDMFKNSYPSTFSDQHSTIMNLSGQHAGRYTLVFGEFSNKGFAERLCKSLWRKDIDCFVMETSLTFAELAEGINTNPATIAALPKTKEERAPVFSPAKAIEQEKIIAIQTPKSSKQKLPPLPEGATLVENMPWLDEPTQRIANTLPKASKINTTQLLASGSEMATRSAVAIATNQAKPNTASARHKPGYIKRGRVEVAEAVRVKPGKRKRVAVATRKPKLTSAVATSPKKVTPVKAMTKVAAKPKKTSVAKKTRPGYWIQVGNYTDQKTAVSIAKVIRNNPNFRGSRLRVVRLPEAVKRNEPSIALRLGTFSSKTKAIGLCRNELSYLRCTVINDYSSGT